MEGIGIGASGFILTFWFTWHVYLTVAPHVTQVVSSLGVTCMLVLVSSEFGSRLWCPCTGYTRTHTHGSLWLMPAGSRPRDEKIVMVQGRIFPFCFHPDIPGAHQAQAALPRSLPVRRYKQNEWVRWCRHRNEILSTPQENMEAVYGLGGQMHDTLQPVSNGAWLARLSSTGLLQPLGFSAFPSTRNMPPAPSAKQSLSDTSGAGHVISTKCVLGARSFLICVPSVVVHTHFCPSYPVSDFTASKAWEGDPLFSAHLTARNMDKSW